ncbi:MAG: cell division protein FtsA [Bdellovibrionales bacterium RIFCSPHIGHO2_01_FULL_40_29]|nr:MAG: cell division protein FtsA [Bdellovibrionales bacterium RIFCSPHIGHO2_01_FULL_40_29]OFZ34007.1 MAG: cell division protein FtsA [Bdellovibrionales bacterium RIFCSPHIGHO2_02_FULL_40_15]
MSTSHSSVKNGPILASLDIGSSSVKLIFSSVNPEGEIEVVGVGTAPNVGLKQGVVVNIEATTESIRKAKEEAELMSGYTTNEVWVSVSGSHIHSFDSKGMVAVKNKEVMTQDIERVIEAAKAVIVPADRTVIHVIPREYKIDTQDGISDPIGMSGVRLEANVHIVTASQSALANISKCIEKAGFKVAGLVLDQVAASTAVLSSDERNLGVCLADIGGGSSKLIYFINGSVAHTSVIPVGGAHFTHDVAVGLRTPQISAEALKKKHGCAVATLVSDEEIVEVEGVGGRKARTLARKELSHILEARAEECLNMIANDIRMSGLQPMLGSGVVLTGGSSGLDGLVEMGEFVFDIPVRRGYPKAVGGLKDVVKGGEFATAIGLLMYALELRKDFYIRKETQPLFSGNMNSSIDGMTTKVKKFFNDLF